MTTFTSTLPDDLLKLLAVKAEKLAIPKSRLIETALRLYLTQLEKAEYITSYKQASDDIEILNISEEGMDDYFNQFLKP